MYLHPTYAIIAALVLALATATAHAQSSDVQSPAIVLNWVDDSDNETGFEVERALVTAKGEIGPFELIATVAENVATYTDDAIQYEQIYAYRVRAINNHGHSDYSNVAKGYSEDLRPNDPQMLLVVFVAPNGKTYTVDFQPTGEPYLIEVKK